MVSAAQTLYLHLTMVSREQPQNYVSHAPSGTSRFINAHSKAKVQWDQLSHLPSLFISLLGGEGCIECSYTSKAWEKCWDHGGIIMALRCPDVFCVNPFLWNFSLVLMLPVFCQPPCFSVAAFGELKYIWWVQLWDIRTSRLLPPAVCRFTLVWSLLHCNHLQRHFVALVTIYHSQKNYGCFLLGFSCQL